MKIDVEEAGKRGLLGKITVRLNGITLNECIMADEEKGIARVYVTGDNKIPLYPLQTKLLQGDIQIILDN